MPVQIKKKIPLDLKGVPVGKKASVKKEVGEYIIDQIFDHLERGKSPVKGEGKFKKLTAPYAKAEKGGRTTPNLELEGDLKDATQAKNNQSGVTVGIFDDGEIPKADGHNQFSGEAKAWAKQKKFPKRRFIPDEGQEFVTKIMKGIDEIIAENRKETKQRKPKVKAIETESAVTVDLEDVINDKDILAELFRQGL